MKTVDQRFKVSLVALAVCSALGWQAHAAAQESPSENGEELEEVVVTGRFISSSQQLVNERMNDAFATDLLGADTISRLGDSTVAGALRRVPGLSVVQDKFVYIRGLGERYSQTTLNGAFIPSPDLTRNVIPLNVFPTSVVESLKVQKSYSPELSANFGGGAVDIRTKGIPDEFTVQFEFGLGVNSENPSKVNTYRGGSDDSYGKDDGTRELSQTIIDGMTTYRGEVNPESILRQLRGTDPNATPFDAQTINLELGSALNRDVGIRETGVDPDYKLRGSVGNKHEIGSDWTFGYNVGASYEQETRWRRTKSASFNNPDEEFGNAEESTSSVNIAGTLNFGLAFGGDHEIDTTTLFLRNTDDEVEIFDFFNPGAQFSQGRGFRDYRLEYEERNMTTNQVKGTHYLGLETRERLGGFARLINWLPEETKIEWYYSESTARTDIPNRVEVITLTDTNTSTAEVEGVQAFRESGAGSFRFTDLDDDVEDYGWKGMMPLEFGSNYVEVSGGYGHAQKARTYEQVEFLLGYSAAITPLEAVTLPSDDLLAIDQLFSDDLLLERPADNPLTGVDESLEYVNGVIFDSTGGSDRSYIAATMTDAAWGKVDWTWNDTWRIAVGARWEDYRQASVAWNPFGFSLGSPQVDIDVDNPDQIAFKEDEIYPSAGITYIGDLWAETFQLRLGYSETAVRPDLREITAASYVDPITGYLTRGNPGVTPAEVENIDLRAEWFFSNGDNLTITLFQKDITNPIEFLETAGSDTTIGREIQNLDSAEVSGIEIEALKELAFLGGVFDTLFVQGNFTFQDTELEPGSSFAPILSCVDTSGTTPKNSCQLSGASDYVANVMIGFDSRDSKHTASLIFNVFGERLFAFGRFGPDAVEQPFESLDFTYFWYPTDRVTVKAKAQNILGSSIEIEQKEPGRTVTRFEEEPGSSYSLAVSWQF